MDFDEDLTPAHVGLMVATGFVLGCFLGFFADTIMEALARLLSAM